MAFQKRLRKKCLCGTSPFFIVICRTSLSGLRAYVSQNGDGINQVVTVKTQKTFHDASLLIEADYLLGFTAFCTPPTS